jgi:hypothetical protein
MKKSKILLLFSLSFLASVTSPCQVPVIISQPTTGEPSTLEDPAFMFYPNLSKDKLFLRLSENTGLPCQVSIVTQEGILIINLLPITLLESLLFYKTDQPQVVF